MISAKKLTIDLSAIESAVRMMDMGFKEDFEQKKGGDNRPKIQREPRDPTVEAARKGTSGKNALAVVEKVISLEIVA